LNDVNGEFNLVKCFLGSGFERVGSVFFGLDVDSLENDYVWEHNQVVNNEECNEKVPDNAWVLFGVN
jgi:hypothetical protein